MGKHASSVQRHSCLIAAVLTVMSFTGLLGSLATAGEGAPIGYDITKTGLTPRYPEGMNCSPLTSLYASWDDVDGTRRDEPHSGVDGGRLGDPIIAPAPGHVLAYWQANWGWGNEKALLIEHTEQDLQLHDAANLVYYSEFDHLSLDEPKTFVAGQPIARGQQLGSVSRPGGRPIYLPEVHWEVWEASPGAKLAWHLNKSRALYWVDNSARLIDPLYMMSRSSVVERDLNVTIHPYITGKDYSNFSGFTYILPCDGERPRQD